MVMLGLLVVFRLQCVWKCVAIEKLSKNKSWYELKELCGRGAQCIMFALECDCNTIPYDQYMLSTVTTFHKLPTSQQATLVWKESLIY